MSGEPCKEFRNGDQTTTLISTENGKIIEIHHNVMTPQPYNRMYQLTGTKGFANKYPFEGFALSSDEMKKSGVMPSSDDISGHSYLSKADADALIKKYESPIVTKYEKQAKEVGGHGGMDFIMDSRLVTVSRMDYHLTLMYTTLLNGVVWQSWGQYQWIMVIFL